MAVKKRGVEYTLGGKDTTAKAFGSVDRRMRELEKRSVSVTRTMGKAFGTVATGIATMGVAAGTAAAGGLLVLTNQAIDLAESLDKMSQRTGLSVEELSTLKFAAEQSGASLELFETGATRFARTISDAARGSATAAQAFGKLGVNIRNEDGTLRDTRDLLDEVADKLAGIEDGNQKAAVAQELFGRSGTQLIPLLNQGSGGMARLQQQARDLGAEIDTNTAKRAADLKDRMNELTTAMGGLGIEAAEKLMPSLVRIAERMVTASKEGGLLKAAIAGVAEAWDEWTSIVTEGEQGQLQQQIAETQAEIEALEAEYKRMTQTGETTFGSLMARLDGITDEQVAATKAKIDGLKAALAAFQADFAAGYEFSEDDLAGIPSFGGESAAPGIPGAPGEAADPGAAEEARRQRLLEQQDFDIAFEEAAVERERKHQEALTKALQDGETKRSKLQISAIVADRKRREAARDAQLKTQASLFGSLAQLTAAFGSHQSKAHKALAKTEAIINMHAGATRALRLPFPENLAAMAQVIAAGKTQISGIDSASAGGGFSGGGATVAPVAPTTPTNIAQQVPAGQTADLSPVVHATIEVHGDFVGSDEKKQEMLEFLEDAAADMRSKIMLRES